MSSFRPPLLSKSGREPVFREGAFDDFVRFSLVSAYQHQEPVGKIWSRIEDRLCIDGFPPRSLPVRLGGGLARFATRLVHILFCDTTFYERLDEQRPLLFADMIGWPSAAMFGLAGA